MDKNIITIRNLVKYYKDNKALSEINIDVKKGDIFGILGVNGSGKSTLLNIISGLLKFNSGECFIFNKDIKKFKKEIQKKIGLVTQDYSIYEDLKAIENIKFIGKLYGLRGNKLKKAVEEAMYLVDISSYAYKYPNTFSGGVKRRLNIACALVHKPEILIMDEPTASLDPISRDYVLNSINEINNAGTTILYTSHYLNEVEQICNDAIIINNGNIVAKGDPYIIKESLKSKKKVSILLYGVCEKYWLDIENIKNILMLNSESVVVNQYNISEFNKKFLITIICDDSAKVIERVVLYINQKKIYIKNIDIKEKSLEDIFINIVNK